jgi:hypothetical protein
VYDFRRSVTEGVCSPTTPTRRREHYGVVAGYWLGCLSRRVVGRPAARTTSTIYIKDDWVNNYTKVVKLWVCSGWLIN